MYQDEVKGAFEMIESLKEDKPFTKKEIAAFEDQYVTVFRQFADITLARKKWEDEEKKAKAAIQRIMDKYEIKSIDNDVIKITRIAPGADKTTVDLDAFAKNEPEEYADLLKDYPKTVKGKAGYVRFDVKKANKK